MTYPAAVFLHGGDSKLRLDLAYALCDRWPSTQAHSFSTPLRDGALGTFHEGDPSMDVGQKLDDLILPESTVTYGEFLKEYAIFLEVLFGGASGLLGNLAAARIETNLRYFSTFVFDDADEVANIRIIADMFEPDTCLLVNLAEGSKPFASDRMKLLNMQGATDQDAILAAIENIRATVFK